MHNATSGLPPTCDLDDNAVGRLRVARPSGAWLTHDLKALSTAALHIRQSSMRTAHSYRGLPAVLPVGGQHASQVVVPQDELAGLRAGGRLTAGFTEGAESTDLCRQGRLLDQSHACNRRLYSS